jgi:predicted RNase H-like HicB family nuclease
MENGTMKNIRFTFWKDGQYYLGYLNDYPDYQTQGFSKEELVANLKEILADIESEVIPYIKKVEEFAVA